MLRVEGIVATAGAAALTFDVPDGQAIGLLSQDLALLLRIAECAAGLRVPKSGHVLIDDLDVVRDAERARVQIAINLSRAAHSLTSLGEHAGTIASTRGTLRVKAADGIARLGLNARTRLNTAAGKSAAALLAALLPDTRVVVLHDPFRALDAATRAKAIDWIRSLAESRVSVVITGVEERDVRAVSHSVIEIGAGR